MKNSIDNFNSIFDQVEKTINVHEDRSFEIALPEEKKKKKKMINNEKSLRDLWTTSSETIYEL